MQKGRRRNAILIGLVVLGTVFAVYWRFHFFLHDLEEYCGLRTHYDRAESMYRLGYPPAVLAPTETAADGSTWQTIYSTDRDAEPKNAMPAGKRVEDFNEWVYFDAKVGLSESTVHVTFDPRTNELVSVSCVDNAEPVSGARHPCPAFLGVQDGDSEDQLREKLGKYSQQRFDGPLKTVRYDDLGVDFVLKRGRVYAIRNNREKGAWPREFWRMVITYVPSI